MDRRRFLTASTVAGIAASVVPLRDDAAGAATQSLRSPEDPPLVVDGMDVSHFTDSYVDSLRAGGVDAVHKEISLDLPGPGGLLSFIDRRADVIHAKTVAQIREARRQGQIAVVFGMQDSGQIQAVIRQGSPTESFGSITSALRAGYEAGVRILGVAFNVLNIFGGGCLDPTVGLTRAGRRLVEEIHKLKIVLDVGGHTGEQTSLDAIALSAGVPVICSHTNVAGLNANMRAISDRLIQAIAGTGGVVGLTAISDFIVRNPENARRHGLRSPQASLADFLDQFDYVRRLVGAEHVGLASDFTTDSGLIIQDLPNNINFSPESLSEGRLAYVKGFENISQLPSVRRGLEQRGWTQAEITKALGENWLRVYRRVWGA